MSEVPSSSIFDNTGKGLNIWILSLDLGRLVGSKVQTTWYTKIKPMNLTKMFFFLDLRFDAELCSSYKHQSAYNHAHQQTTRI